MKNKEAKATKITSSTQLLRSVKAWPFLILLSFITILSVLSLGYISTETSFIPTEVLKLSDPSGFVTAVIPVFMIILGFS